MQAQEGKIARSARADRMLRLTAATALAVVAVAAAIALGLSRGGATASAATEYGPPNTAPPTIAGTPQEGQTLTASAGSWTGSGLKFAYQWRRCGRSCARTSGSRGRAG